MPRVDPMPWAPRGACRGADPSDWYSEVGGPQDYERAKSRCARCPVSEDCLTWALENHEAYGVWGGKTPNERAALRRERGLPSLRQIERQQRVEDARFLASTGANTTIIASTLGVTIPIVQDYLAGRPSDRHVSS